jgi:hypothetical protein
MTSTKDFAGHPARHVGPFHRNAQVVPDPPRSDGVRFRSGAADVGPDTVVNVTYSVVSHDFIGYEPARGHVDVYPQDLASR